jgi:ATP-dependent DNA helicase RecG
MSGIILGSSLTPTKIYRDTDSEDAAAQVTAQAEVLILKFCKIARSRDDIQSFPGSKHQEHFRKDILNPLIKKGKLKLTIPEKPSSPNQKYITAEE